MLASMVLIALTVAVLAAVGGTDPAAGRPRSDTARGLPAAVRRGVVRLAELQERRGSVGPRP